MTCAYCKEITVCAICGKGIGEADAIDMRSAFEAWAADQGFQLSRLDVSDGTSYQDLRTQGPWDAWQACWRQRTHGVLGREEVRQEIEGAKARYAAMRNAGVTGTCPKFDTCQSQAQPGFHSCGDFGCAGAKVASAHAIDEGWKEACIAWEVCASLHREYCKGKDPFYKTRQADFVRHAEDAHKRARGVPPSFNDQPRRAAMTIEKITNFLGLWNASCGSSQVLWTGSTLEAAAQEWQRLVANGETDVDLTAYGRGEVASHREMQWRYGTPTASFACPICGKETPHEHTGEAIALHRQLEGWKQRDMEKRWERIEARISELTALNAADGVPLGSGETKGGND